MNNRESIEKREYEFLSPLACHAAESKGRQFDEEQCEYRTDFQRDRDRIVHSKAFRRLIHKTQVFLAPEGDHYRTRLTHTLEVQQIARTIARILAYNEDLTEAIALGHDLGHTPFGHVGEKVLNKIHPGGFEHNVQSLRTVDIIEDTSRRRGLNLTYEVRDGILNHRGPVTPATLEEREVSILGSTHADRINNLIVDLCKNSEGKDTISLSPEFAGSLDRLREFMFENVYSSKKVRGVSDLDKVERIISSLYSYYMEHSDEIPGIYKQIEKEEGTAVAVKDLISGMTDRYALNLYEKLFVPQEWRQL